MPATVPGRRARSQPAALSLRRGRPSGRRAENRLAQLAVAETYREHRGRPGGEAPGRRAEPADPLADALGFARDLDPADAAGARALARVGDPGVALDEERQ